MPYSTPVGPLTIAVDEDGSVAEIRFRSGEHRGDVGHVIAQLDEYFRGERRDFDLTLAPRGTAFQLAVWNELQRIPYGATISYRDLAHRIARPAAIRACGSANGANPIPIIIPCHRVIGANGTLVGYGGGLHIKRTLLALEQPQRVLVETA